MTAEVKTGCWPVQDAERRNAVGIGDDIGEKRCVFVAARVELGAVCDLFKAQHPKTLPRLKVFGDRDGDSGFVRDECGIRHDVTLEQRNVHDARVFDPAAAGASLV